MADSSRSSDFSHAILLSVFLLLAFIAVVLRFWARKLRKVPLETNDYLIVPAFVVNLALTGYLIYGCCGNQQHVVRPPQDAAAVAIDIRESLMAQLIGPILWAVAVFFVRASIVCLYIRLFRVHSFIITWYAILIVNTAFLISVVLTSCLICQPVAYRWNRTIDGICGDQKRLDLFIAVFNLILDVTVVVLPMPILWGLQMPTKKKVVLSGIFGMGIAICILTTLRIQITTTINQRSASAAKQYQSIAMITSSEATFGIINACLPVLKPVFTKLGQLPFGQKPSIDTPGTTPSSNLVVISVRHMLDDMSRKLSPRSNRRRVPNNTTNTTSASIPLVMRVSQMLGTLTAIYTSRMDATTSTETELKAVDEINGGTLMPGDKEQGHGVYKEPVVAIRAKECPEETKSLEIHVRRDVDVERAEDEDCMSLDPRREAWFNP